MAYRTCTKGDERLQPPSTDTVLEQLRLLDKHAWFLGSKAGKPYIKDVTRCIIFRAVKWPGFMYFVHKTGTLSFHNPFDEISAELPVTEEQQEELRRLYKKTRKHLQATRFQKTNL